MSHQSLALLYGPIGFAYLLSALAIGALLAGAAGRLDGFVGLGLRAAERLQRSWAIPILWGIVSTILVLFVSGTLMHSPSGLVKVAGMALLAAMIVVGGLGLAASGSHLGRRLYDAMGEYDRTPSDCLRAGLSGLFVAAICPFLGWLVGVIVVAAGVGAAIEAASSRK